MISQVHKDLKYCFLLFPLANLPLPSYTVNNAGFGLIGPVESQSMASIQHLFDTNFFGLVRLIQEIFPDMKRRKRGHIVVMSSVLGLQGEAPFRGQRRMW